MKNLFKTIFIQLIFISILFGSITYASISWPSYIPAGETTGGIFTKYFENIKGDCSSGSVLEGFDENFNKICKEVIIIEDCPVDHGGGERKYINGGRSDCEVTWCTTDYYKTGTSTCGRVGTGKYSTSTSILKKYCSTKPLYDSHYTSDGNGMDNCSWSCDTGYVYNSSTRKCEKPLPIIHSLTASPSSRTLSLPSGRTGINVCITTSNATSCSWCGVSLPCNGCRTLIADGEYSRVTCAAKASDSEGNQALKYGTTNCSCSGIDQSTCSYDGFGGSCGGSTSCHGTKLICN